MDLIPTAPSPLLTSTADEFPVPGGVVAPGLGAVDGGQHADLRPGGLHLRGRAAAALRSRGASEGRRLVVVRCCLRWAFI